MSEWLKLDDDHYALTPSPDPQEIVSISELTAQIEELQPQIDAIKDLEYPEGASDEVKQAIDEWNMHKMGDRAGLESLKHELEEKKISILGD